MNKHLIGIMGPSTGGKSTLLGGLLSNPVYGRVSFGDYLREVATERGWDGTKTPSGRAFLQKVSEDLKREFGESVFYDIGVLKALQNPAPVVLFDDMRFFIEISQIIQEHESFIGSIIVINEPEAEYRWECSALSRAEEDAWAWHRSEHEWRCLRHLFPQFDNKKELGVDYGIEKFTEFVTNHVNEHQKRSESYNA